MVAWEAIVNCDTKQAYIDNCNRFKIVCDKFPKIQSRAAGYEVIGCNDLYLVEHIDPKEKVAADKKVRHRVKFENDENINLDDCSINLGAN